MRLLTKTPNLDLSLWIKNQCHHHHLLLIINLLLPASWQKLEVQNQNHHHHQHINNEEQKFPSTRQTARNNCKMITHSSFSKLNITPRPLSFQIPKIEFQITQILHNYFQLNGNSLFKSEHRSYCGFLQVMMMIQRVVQIFHQHQHMTIIMNVQRCFQRWSL